MYDIFICTNLEYILLPRIYIFFYQLKFIFFFFSYKFEQCVFIDYDISEKLFMRGFPRIYEVKANKILMDSNLILTRTTGLMKAYAYNIYIL